MCLSGTHCATLRSVKYFTWDDAKNEKLKADRGIGFEEIVFLIGQGHVLDILEHPNQQRYGGQRIFVVQRDDYVYLVPFVEDDKSDRVEDDHSESQSHEALLEERAGRS